MFLNLGVIDLPYVAPPSAPKSRGPKPHAAHAKEYGNSTTGDVAEILEGKYHIMEVFFEWNAAEVTAYLEDSTEKACRSLFAGAPSTLNPFAGGTSKIEAAFKQFLAQGEIETFGIPGVPTQAALDGVSHRFKSGVNWAWEVGPNGKRRKVHGVRRPSFIDTGLYQASFKAWVE
jgi:hypothetical protein